MSKFKFIQGIKVVVNKNNTTIIDYTNLAINTELCKYAKHDPNIPGKYAELNYDKRLSTRKTKIKEIIYNNFEVDKSAHIVLTFDPKNAPKEQIEDIRHTHSEFKKFIKRVSDHLDGFKYIATFARQGNDNWHYHLVCNVSSIKEKKIISDLWFCGFITVDFITTKEHLFNCVGYLIKNMLRNANELRGQRGYLASRNLQRSKVLKSWNASDHAELDKAFDKIKQGKIKLCYENSHEIGIYSTLKDDFILNGELTLVAMKLGYKKINTDCIHYSSDVRFPELFNEIKTATVKVVRKKKPRKKNKRKQSKKRSAHKKKP